MDNYSITSEPPSPLPADDRSRNLTVASADEDPNLTHLGIAGDTYTIVLSGDDTEGRFCLIDMLIPPGGGPAPHRHDFEETFTMLQGEVQVTFRGQKSMVKAGESANIPANAPHEFHNISNQSVRLLCLCAPAGQEEYFKHIGVPLATRTTPAPKLDDAGKAAFIALAGSFSAQYRTEMLQTTVEPS